MAEEEANENQESAEKSGGIGKILLFAGIAVVLLAIGVFAGLTLMKPDAPAETDDTAEADAATPAPAFYTSLHPPLVVNFKDELGDPHVMQITLEVMATDQVSINSVREHIPVIRNSLILLFGSSVYEEVVTREGKEQLLADGLVEVQRIMTEKVGDHEVEALYFTGLVIQ